MVIRNYEVAEVRMGFDGSTDVLFRGVAYDLKAKGFEKARKEAAELLDKKFPEVTIYLK